MKVNKPKHGITRRLIIYVVLFSSCITLLITAVQLFQEYRDGVAQVEGQMTQVETLSVPSLTQNLWDLYDEQVQILLDNLIQLPDVKYLEIRSRGQVVASSGIPSTPNAVSQVLPLIHLQEDEGILIGELLLVATLEGVHQRIYDRVVITLISNAFKTALVSIFVFLVFQSLVTRHLLSMSKHLATLSVDHLDRKFSLDRRPTEDELEQVVVAINEMGQNLNRTTVAKSYVDNIIASMGDPLFVVNSDGRIRLANKRSRDLLGYKEQDLAGKCIIDLLDEDEGVLLGEEVEGGTVGDLEATCFSKDGKRIPVLVSKSTLRDEEGQTQGAVYVVHDITERKAAEEQRQRLIELARKNSELERFTYTVSHDLKSPLVTIQGFLGLVKKDALSGDAERLQADLDRINSASNHMRRLLDELLKWARVGQEAPKYERVELDELIPEAVAMVSGELEERSVTVEIATELPAVRGERHRLREVFQNLLSNAAKFMDTQVTPRIKLGASVRYDQVECFVEDNGPGIVPRYHEKIFGLFERLDQKQEGTGVGLAIVKRIIEQHNGRIWVESEGERLGSVFRFTLPIHLN